MHLLDPTSVPIGHRAAVLVPRWTDGEASSPQGTPFRTFTLVGALLAAGYEVVFCDQEQGFDRHDRRAELIASLEGCAAAFIWMNEMYPFNQCENAHRLGAFLKRHRPDLPVVVGGEFVSICPSGFFNFPHPEVDYFLRGFGEESSLLLLGHLLAGREPVGVPGLAWTDSRGRHHDLPAERKARFQREWLAPYELVDMKPYIQIGGVLGNDQPTLTVAAGRGCVKGCAFCAWSNHRARLLDADIYFELLAGLRRRYGVRQFHIAELDFFTAPKRALALARRLRDELPDVVWFALGSPIDLVALQDEDWELLHAGGLRKVEVGSESGSADMLRRIGKQHVPEDIYLCSRRMVDHGIRPLNNFLFGFPGERSADRAASLDMIRRLFELSPRLCHFTYRYYQPVWGTPVGDAALGRVPDLPGRLDRWLAERHRYHREEERTMPWISRDDERELKELINFQLPLATSMLGIDSPWRRRIYGALQRRARDAGARGVRVSSWDRWLYRRVVGRRLDQTYIP